MLTIRLNNGSCMDAISIREEYNPNFTDIRSLYMEITLTNDSSVTLQELINILTPDSISTMIVENKETGVNYTVTGYNRISFLRRDFNNDKVQTILRLAQV